MISILMPVKNAENYLNACIDSIIDQTISDWELIAVNDGSSDATGSILKQYEKQDKRIKSLENPGKGIIDALSSAYKISSGVYITRMDADDIMLSTKLQKLLALVVENPQTIATGKVAYFSDTQLGDGYTRYAEWLNELIDFRSHYAHIYKECVLPSPCWMMHKTVLESIGGFNSLQYPEDYDLCFKAYAKKIEIYGVDEVLHNWRDYPERTSRNDENYADNSFLQLKLKYFRQCDLDKKKVLILWGAGNRGKRMAKFLIDAGIQFEWCTNNENKIGHNIYGKILKPQNFILTQENCQVLVSIADKSAEKTINKIVETLPNQDVYMFC